VHADCFNTNVEGVAVAIRYQQAFIPVTAILLLASCGSQDAPKAMIEQRDQTAAQDAGSAPPAPVPGQPKVEFITGTNPALQQGSPPISLFDIELGATADQARGVLKRAGQKGLTDYVESLNLLSLQGDRYLTSIAASDRQLTNRSAVLLLGPPNAPQVWYIGRSAKYPLGQGPSIDSTLKSLEERYGPPHKRVGQDYGPTLYWMWDAAGTPFKEGVRMECSSGAMSGAPIGDPPGNPAGVYLPGTSGSMFTRDYPCARIVKAGFQSHNGIVFDLHIGATDYAMGQEGSKRTAQYVNQELAKKNREAIDRADGRAPDL
jgi:hypothetical protein